MLVRDLKHVLVARHNGQARPASSARLGQAAPHRVTKIVVLAMWNTLVQEDQKYLNIPIRVNIFYNNMNTHTQAFWCPSVIRELYACKR